MGTSAEKRYSAEEYLAFERESPTKHEYFDGELFAMAGASQPHSALSSNIGRLIGNLVVERGCIVHDSDMRVLCPTGLYTYPDVSVVCGEIELDEDESNSLLNPLVIVEVLSKSTEAYDRGRKFENYKSIASLADYVLVSQAEPRVECFHRESTGDWPRADAVGIEASIAIPSIDCELELREIYRNVKLGAE